MGTTTVFCKIDIKVAHKLWSLVMSRQGNDASRDVSREVMVKAAAGAAPYALLYCPQCGSLPSSHEQDSNYPWSLQLKCTSCQPGTK